MVSCGMLRRVTLVRTDVSEEPGASFLRVTRIGELGTTQASTSNLVFLRSVRRLLVTASVVPSTTILVTLIKEAPQETHYFSATMQRDNTQPRAYPCKCLTFGCLATTGVSNLRLPNNDGIRPNVTIL
jgi:hypothetical protein